MMDALIYLAAAYTVFWLVSFVFIFSMVQRQKNLQKEVELLERLTGDTQELSD